MDCRMEESEFLRDKTANWETLVAITIIITEYTPRNVLDRINENNSPCYLVDLWQDKNNKIYYIRRDNPFQRFQFPE